MKSQLLLVLLALAASVHASAAKAPKVPYSYTRVGNAADLAVSSINLKGGVALMGGGPDVDAAFPWLSRHGAQGDILVIRATGTDAYNPYILDLCSSAGAPANSVATLIIPTVTAANDVRVYQLIMQAEAIWIAGGDQSNYINFWKGTPVQQALQRRIDAGIPIGGTSAGMNVLSQFIYSAQGSQGVTSAQALANPLNRYMTFDRNFLNLPILTGVIADPHFDARDRMGRDLAFLGRVATNGWSAPLLPPRCVSIDVETALLIDESDTPGLGTVVGTGFVYFLQAPGAPQVCVAKVPLTYKNVGVYRINKAGAGLFDLVNWLGWNGTSYQVSATVGVLSSTQPGGSVY